jgi:hypothetical protein
MRTVEGFLKDELIDKFVEGYISRAAFEEGLRDIRMAVKPEEDLYRRAVLKWGRPIQVDWAIEEMAELTQALCKSKRNGRQKDWIYNIYEEMADVQIMLDTLRIVFNAGSMVEQYKIQKLDRLERRLEAKPGMEE